MDVVAVRRRNLRELIAKHGGPTEFAAKIDRTSNYVTQLQGDYKAFGNSAARNIEQQLSLEHGWMDRPQWDAVHVAEDGKPYAIEVKTTDSSASQSVSLQDLTLAVQLVEEALEGLTLPPPKKAELTVTVYELLGEGLTQAKVLRFVRAAVR
jgi:hypothetical protein